MPKFYEYIEGKGIEWLELNLLKNNLSISKSKIISLTGIEDERIIDSIISELESRVSLYDDPIYEIEDNLIKPLKSYNEIPEYFLCLFFSYFGAANNKQGTKLFEVISGHALRNYLNGEIKILGFPGGSNLNTFLDEIALACYEPRGMQANSDYKDDGVDVIGYKLFDDKRSGNIYVLMQCAAGIHWKTKSSINLNNWTNYIHWFKESIVSTISTTEYVQDKEWKKRESKFGILFDRLRIYNWLYKDEVADEVRLPALEWCEQNLEQ